MELNGLLLARKSIPSHIGSSTWMNTAVLVTCIRNFKNNQGPISGILKGYVGLSTAIFTDLSTALFSANPSAFLLTLAVIPAIICLIAALFLGEMPPTTSDEKHQLPIFHFFNIVAIIVALYLLGFDITGSHGRVVSLGFAAGLLVLLVTPIYVPIYLILGKPNLNSAEEQPSESLLVQNEKEDIILEDVLEVERHPRIGDDHTILEAMCTFDFWVLFVTFLCGVGTGMCVLNNLGQMARALGYLDVSIFISLTSIWGFFDRIISGMASEYSIEKYATPRPIWNAVSQILMASGYIVMAIAFPGSLYIGSILVGICYGVRLSVTVPIASELFGLKYYGMLYNILILILNLPLGSFLFSGLLAGYLYDAQATANPAGAGNTCIGPHCYRLVFVILALACVFGFGLDMLLALRTRALYLKIYDKEVQENCGKIYCHKL